MSRPSQIELNLIRRMLAKEYGFESPFLAQVPLLQSDGPHFTGTGYYLRFENCDQDPGMAKKNNEITAFLNTRLPPPQDTVGFTLFIKEGRVSSFEAYTFGDVRWPSEPMEDWLVLDEPATTLPTAS